MSLYERRPKSGGNDPALVRRKLHNQFRRTFERGTTLTMDTLWRTSRTGIIANVVGGVYMTQSEGELLICAVNVGAADAPKSPTQYLLYTKLGTGAMSLMLGIAASRFERPASDQYVKRDLRGASLLRVMNVSPLATRQATVEYSARLIMSTEPADPSIEALIQEDPSLKAIEEYGARLRDFREGNIPPLPPDDIQ